MENNIPAVDLLRGSGVPFYLECDWLYGEHTVVGIEDNMYAKNEDAIRSEIEKCKIILETFPLSDSIDYDDAVSRVRATQEGREIEQSEPYTRNDIFLRDASNFYVKNPFLRTAALAAGRHEIDIERYIANDDISLISYSLIFYAAQCFDGLILILGQLMLALHLMPKHFWRTLKIIIYAQCGNDNFPKEKNP